MTNRDEREVARLRAALEDVWKTIQRDVRVLANLDPVELGGIVARALEAPRSEAPEPSADADLMDRLKDSFRKAPEPQGEPSDAQVLAAFNAFFGLEVDHVSEGTSTRMRAALRAAGGVR